MKPAVELDELIERIRNGAERENGLAASARQDASVPTDMPSVPGAVLPPPAPALASASTGDAASRPESLLDQAAAWLQGGRQKNAVPDSVPKVLRPLFRNQGGYNSVLLEAVERLVEVNRRLRQQNFELQERLMYFDAWAHSVAQTSAENRDWMLAAAARLEAFPSEEASLQPTRAQSQFVQDETARSAATDFSGALPQIEARLSTLTAHSEATETERRAINDHLNRLRAQISEQADYIRTVHHHLDQLGAHVEASLARLTQPQ